MSAPFLVIDRVSVAYGTTPVLCDVSLQVGEGEFVALLGSSGCGKTTLLRSVAGFVRPSAGRISADGRDITDLPPHKRNLALVFQSYALWPHMTVGENIAYGLKLRRLPRAEITTKIGSILAMLGLDGLDERPVTALSGGQRQRVALGRALAIDPRLLLLDEPLSNLDARIRLSVRHEIRALQQRLRITTIHVTHDREEAMVMADRIIILNGGRIEQAGAPETIYNHPATPFVANFMGADNVLEIEAEVAGDDLLVRPSSHYAAARLPLGTVMGQAGGGRFRAHFRSEAAELLPIDAKPHSGEATPGAIVLSGTVAQCSYPGGVWRHEVKVGGRDFLVDHRERAEAGSAVLVRLPASALFLFPLSTTGKVDKPEGEFEAAGPSPVQQPRRKRR